MFFMSREDFWKTHIVDTWKTWTRHERALRKFGMRWLFHGMVRCEPSQ